MTRREFTLAPLVFAAAAPDAGRVAIPLHRIVDSKTRFSPGALERFWREIWPQAFTELARGGIDLQTTDGAGGIEYTAADRPLFIGLEKGALNLMLTDRLPIYWDNARALPGATTVDRGYCLCVLALRFAHPNRVPFFSTNTCVHEMMHALLLDIFVARP